MTPLSAKTGGEGNVEGEETKKYERDEGKGDGEDERDERRSSGVIVRRKGEEGREREREKNDGEKTKRVVPAVDLSTLDARIAALKQYTVYPWAIDQVQACLVVRG